MALKHVSLQEKITHRRAKNIAERIPCVIFCSTGEHLVLQMEEYVYKRIVRSTPQTNNFHNAKLPILLDKETAYEAVKPLST